MTGSFTNTSQRRLEVENVGDEKETRIVDVGETVENVAPGSDHNKALEESGELTRQQSAKAADRKTTKED